MSDYLGDLPDFLVIPAFDSENDVMTLLKLALSQTKMEFKCLI